MADPRHDARTASTVAALLVGAVTVGAVAVLALRDPHEPGSYLGCPLYVLTGLVCAGCGGLRAVHDLATGDLAGAWSMNPFLVVAAPLLVLGWMSWLMRARTGRGLLGRLRGRPERGLAGAPRHGLLAPWLLLVSLALVSAVRNVPGLAPWLVPGGG